MPDLATWPQNLTIDDFLATARMRRSAATTRVVLLRGGQMYFVGQAQDIDECTSPCDRMVRGQPATAASLPCCCWSG